MNSRAILVGDFNLNLYNPRNLGFINNFINGMLGHNFLNMINLPTVINENNTITKYSLIDQIWTNFDRHVNQLSGVIDYLITDHLPIFYVFSKQDCVYRKSIKYRLINERNMFSFINNFNDSDFSDVYSINEPNNAFKIFYDKLFELYRASFPLKKKRLREGFLSEPWVTPLLKRCVRKKFKLYNLLKRGIISRNTFNKYKKVLSIVTKKMRSHYYKIRFLNCKDNSRRTWENINVLMNRKLKKGIDRVCDSTGNFVSGQELSNCFNDYFSGIADNLTRHLPQTINYDFLNHINPTVNTCFLYPTDDVEVSNLILSLPNKGNSLSDIKPKILCRIIDKLVPILVYLYNFCIDGGVYPEVLKVARCVPVYKDGSVFDVGNYRPISNLSSLNKIFEKLTYKRMLYFVSRFNILSNIQYGFRPGMSTTLAIFSLMKDLVTTFNKKHFTMALFLDLRKAFDVVNRDILLKKLELYGFRGRATEFLSSYLTGRCQYVSLNGFDSYVSNCNFGVPQGSVLGPLLFNLFINDIDGLQNASKILFADDAMIYVSDPDLDTCATRMNAVVEELYVWLKNNRLVANVTKTKVMLITPKPKNNVPDISFGASVVERVSCIKYLGLLIDDMLTFVPHVNNLCTRLSQFQGITYSLSPFLNFIFHLNLYKSLIYPMIFQNIIIWGCLPQLYVNKITVIVNNILRNILRVKRDVNNIPLISNNNLYKSLGLLKFTDIYKLFLLKFIHFVYYDRFDVFIENFAEWLPQSCYNTRSNRINLPNVRTEVEKRFAIYQCCSLIRSLPEDLLQPQSKSSLNTKFIEFALSRYN